MVPPGTYQVMGGMVCPDNPQCFSTWNMPPSPDELTPTPLRSPLVSFTIH
jgi:hypothetical protein